MNPLQYPAAAQPWADNIFQNPPAEYRGAPLWCWNNKLERKQLLRQITHLQDMGMGGFHIHSRTGLGTQYMGEEFMQHVEACTALAKEKGMMACLYDEDRWPSGAAGGLVVAENPEFSAQHLLLTKKPYELANLPPVVQGANGKACRSNMGTLAARYDIVLDGRGRVKSYQKLEGENPSGPDTWHAYVEPNPPSEWFNNQTYVDTLNPNAIKKFIETTHEKYYTSLASEFGATVPSIFTDEPQFAHKSRLARSSDTNDLFLPWSADLPDTFKQKYGYDIWDKLPGILWDTESVETEELNTSALAASRTARYHFHDHVCERFVTAFMDQVAGWCRERNIALIGHMMKEPTLLSQTQALGEAMRCYRRLDMPGVDMLCDAMEFNTVKQAASVARQNGARGVMSEIYGVTNWTFDFAGHKGSGDWQAALGITFRVHHLTWVSMQGEAKRDYPACIGYQSPWYKEYKYIEDHFARVNVAMTRGRPLVRVGVIHPIESFWLCYGPTDANGAEARFREDAFSDLTSWLLFGLIDFDFISESLLPDQTSLDDIQANKPFPVGQSQYDVILAPNLNTIRSTTMERLARFADCGGRVIFTGTIPSLLDGSIPFTLDKARFSTVSWTQYHLLSALETYREVRIVLKDGGSATEHMLYQLRKEDDKQFLFICNTQRKRYFQTEVAVKGEWNVTVLDTLSGDRSALVLAHAEGWTSFDWHFEACASVLLELAPREKPEAGPISAQAIYRDEWTTTALVELVNIELSEPNVMVLDYASFSLDGGPWEPVTEILRIDNLVRDRLSLPLKGEAYRQPWAVTPEERKPKAILRLRYEIICDTTVSACKLAIELAAGMKITLDGKPIIAERSGWWVDEDISTIQLPDKMAQGTHVLEVSLPFELLTNLERIYLLGDFAVDVRGTQCRLQPLDLSKITFGNWTTQGLPCYAGNVTYKCRFTAQAKEGQPYILHVPHFSAPVMTAFLDSKKVGVIALQPYVVDLGILNPAQEYNVDIVCFGNRENAFGTLHMPDGVSKWFAPNAWRTEHDWWIEGYNVKRMGILDNPRIKSPGKETWVVPRNPERLWTCCD